MPATELAILPLTSISSSSADDLPSSLIKKLSIAKKVLEEASGHKFYYFQQFEDPRKLYIIGKWNSIEDHQAFLFSPENQQLLTDLENDIDEEHIIMYHLDGDVFATSTNSPSVLEAPLISINRHFLESRKINAFKFKWATAGEILESHTKPFRPVSGWRIEKEVAAESERREEEWVLFIGWESMDQEINMANMRGFATYKEYTEYVDGFDLKHVMKVKGLHG